MVVLFGLLLAAVSSAISTTAVKTTMPYYDLKIFTNKDVYYQNETVELTITLINRGPLPDRDVILTVFVDDSPLHQEILQQAVVGTTIINKTFNVGNMSLGIHTAKVEYDIAHEGDLLIAFSKFTVDPYPVLIPVMGLVVTPYQLLIPVPNLVVTILSVIVILLVLAGIRKIRKHV